MPFSRTSIIYAAMVSAALCASHSQADELSVLRAKAEAYEHGEGMPKDPLRALELYCEGAARGDIESQYRLGWMYANGRGVLRNDELAAALFALAAEQGDAQSRAMLAHLPPPASDLPECMREHPLTADYDDSVVVLALDPPAPVESRPFVAASPEERRIAYLVQEIAPQFQVSPTLALAFIRVESNFDARATSPKNAQGLMQLIPETAQRFNVKRPYDAVQNIRGGIAYLQWLLAYFRGNVPLVAAAYNAGEGAVERYHGIPPYAETREYVKRVLALFGSAEHPFDPSVVDASPELPRIRQLRFSH